MRHNFFGTIALMLSIAIALIYVNPLWTGTIADTKAAIESDNQALDAARAYTARQNELLAQKSAIEPSNLTRLETLLPDSVDNVTLILDLNALAARSGVTLSNFDVSQNSAASGSSGANGLDASNPVGSINLSLSAVGSYSAFHKFFDGVEKSERLLDVRDLAVTGSSNGIYTYQMTMRIYWLR